MVRRALLARCLTCEVSKRNEAGQGAICRQHRQAPDTKVRHASLRLHHGLIGTAALDLVRHGGLDLQFMQGLAAEQRRHADVTVGDDPCQTTSLVHADRQTPAVLLPHQPRRVVQRIAGRAGGDRSGHDGVNAHGTLLWARGVIRRVDYPRGAGRGQYVHVLGYAA